MLCTSRLMSTALTSCGCWRENASRRCTRVGGALGGLARDSSRRWMRGLSSPRRRERDVDVAEDHGQHVVEVVRDAAGQPADRFHLLRLAQRLLGRLRAGCTSCCRRSVRAQRDEAEADQRQRRRNAEDQMARHGEHPGADDGGLSTPTAT